MDVENLAPTGIWSTDHLAPLASRYTYYTIPAHTLVIICNSNITYMVFTIIIIIILSFL